MRSAADSSGWVGKNSKRQRRSRIWTMRTCGGRCRISRAEVKPLDWPSSEGAVAGLWGSGPMSWICTATPRKNPCAARLSSMAVTSTAEPTEPRNSRSCAVLQGWGGSRKTGKRSMNPERSLSCFRVKGAEIVGWPLARPASRAARLLGCSVRSSPQMLWLLSNGQRNSSKKYSSRTALGMAGKAMPVRKACSCMRLA